MKVEARDSVSIFYDVSDTDGQPMIEYIYIQKMNSSRWNPAQHHTSIRRIAKRQWYISVMLNRVGGYVHIQASASEPHRRFWIDRDKDGV